MQYSVFSGYIFPKWILSQMFQSPDPAARPSVRPSCTTGYQTGSCSSISQFTGYRTGSCSSILSSQAIKMGRVPVFLSSKLSQNGSCSSISQFTSYQNGSFSNISRIPGFQSDSKPNQKEYALFKAINIHI